MDVTLTQVNHMTVPFEALQVNELIGEGSYATVYRGVWRNKIVCKKNDRRGENRAEAGKKRVIINI